MTLKLALDAVTDNALSLPTIVGSVVIVMRGDDEVYRRY